MTIETIGKGMECEQRNTHNHGYLRGKEISHTGLSVYIFPSFPMLFDRMTNEWK